MEVIADAFGAWEIGPAETALTAAIYVFGGVVKGATGFGLPLIAISLTPLFLPLDLALALNALVIPATNVGQFAALGGYRRSVAICWPLILGLCAAVFFAASLAKAAPPAAISAVLGAVLILFVGQAFAAPSFRIAPGARKPAALAAGLVGGVVGAAVTAPGPVFAMYFVGLGLDRRALISAMALSMLSVGLLISGAFALLGLLDAARAAMSAAAIAPAAAGMVIGDRLARSMSVEGFRRLVLLILLGLGCYHIWRAVG